MEQSYFDGHSGVSGASSRHSGGKGRYQRVTLIRDTVLPVYSCDRAVSFSRESPPDARAVGSL
jgi:hypothetical protein